MESSLRVAIGSVPKDGGTFTFYRNQRHALAGHGIDLQCVTLGLAEAALVEDAYVDDGCALLGPDLGDVEDQAMVFVEWCEQAKIDIVMAVNSVAILSAIPHLPEQVRVISRCANAFDHGYRIAMSGRERLAGIVALVPRLEGDLIQRCDADPSLIRLIPNGIEPSPFERAAARLRGQGPKLEVGFLGRLEHNQKGVLHLPKIVEALRSSGVAFHLRIAGKGVHREALERDLKPSIDDGTVELVGQLTASEIPTFLGGVDVFLFTSHFEGCPNALLEAMMAGCVPVSWIIEGITDFIIQNGETGSLVPMGDCRAFARQVAALAGSRERLRDLSHNAGEAARERFSNTVSAAAYARLFRDVMNEPPPLWEPKPWSDFEVDPAFRSSWKDRIPRPWKTMGKKLLYLGGFSSRTR